VERKQEESEVKEWTAQHAKLQFNLAALDQRFISQASCGTRSILI